MVSVLEAVEFEDGASLDTEHRVELAFDHFVEQGEGEVSAIEDHDIAG